MRGIWLFAIYLGIIVLPLILAAVGAKPPRPVWDEIASGAGMVAFAILLAEFLLSGRFRAISGGVGMDVTMRFHQLLARSALALVIVHPFLYTTPFGWALPYDPSRQWTLVQPGPALMAGAAAWILLPAFVLVSIARSDLFKRYENWRWAHGLGAALIAGLSWYHATQAGRYSSDPALYWLWTGLFAVAILSLASVYVLRPITKLRRPWKVCEIRKAADQTWAVDLEPVGHDGISYKAGQFFWLHIGHSAFSLSENPFSVASAPAQKGKLSFVIKELGDFTSTLGSIPQGAKAYVDGPFGHMTIEGRHEPGIGLVAGGVGIAPMLSILRELDATGDTRPVKLVYGNRNEGQIVASEELDRYAQRPDVDVVHVVAEPGPDWCGETGITDAAFIRRHFGRPEQRDWLYVLCGPPAMMTGAEEVLLALGVAPNNILSERFTYD